jgi:hypothetical protein
MLLFPLRTTCPVHSAEASVFVLRCRGIKFSEVTLRWFYCKMKATLFSWRQVRKDRGKYYSNQISVEMKWHLLHSNQWQCKYWTVFIGVWY